MTARERLVEQIDTLKEAIQLSWKDMAQEPMSREDRVALRGIIAKMVDDLRDCLEDLDALDA